MQKYEIHNQLTGLNEEALTFEDAKVLREKLKNDYIQAMVEKLFVITVLVQNEDGSWTQSIADENGNLVANEHYNLTEEAK